MTVTADGMFQSFGGFFAVNPSSVLIALLFLSILNEKIKTIIIKYSIITKRANRLSDV